MTRFFVDDRLHAHPKALDAGLAAMGLWAMAGSYVAAYLTDGFVPSSFIRGYDNGFRCARKLVEVGLWEKVERDGQSGYVFHDWGDHGNPTSDAVKRYRKAAAERQRRKRDQDQPTLSLVRNNGQDPGG